MRERVCMRGRMVCVIMCVCLCVYVCMHAPVRACLCVFACVFCLCVCTRVFSTTTTAGITTTIPTPPTCIQHIRPHLRQPRHPCPPTRPLNRHLPTGREPPEKRLGRLEPPGRVAPRHISIGQQQGGCQEVGGQFKLAEADGRGGAAWCFLYLVAQAVAAALDWERAGVGGVRAPGLGVVGTDVGGCVLQVQGSRTPTWRACSPGGEGLKVSA